MPKTTKTTDAKEKPVKTDETTKTTDAKEEKVEVVFGMDKSEYDKLSYRDQVRVQMNDKTSELANQTTPEHTVTVQLVNSTPVQLIEAMTGKDLDYIKKEAERLGLSVKTTAAGDLVK